MKRFLFLVFALTVLESSGQDYPPFQLSSKKLFTTTPVPTSGYSVYFDSANVVVGDTGYYNFFSVPDTEANFPPGTCVFWNSGCLFHQDFPSWMGRKMEHAASGLYRFFTNSNNILTFDLNTSIGDTTLFFTDVSQRFFLIRDPNDSITVFGNTDSAKYFRIYHTDNSGNEINSALDQKKIICSNAVPVAYLQ